jgi:hypothetical protein
VLGPVHIVTSLEHLGTVPGVQVTSLFVLGLFEYLSITTELVCEWFSTDTQVSPTNKTDHHDITEIVLKVALSTVTLTPNIFVNSY